MRAAPSCGSTSTAPTCTVSACPAAASSRAPMLRPGSFALTLLLAMLTGIGPLSVDMYLASLPSIGRLLDAPTSQVQLTISAYLIGFAIAQIFHGPLSDRHGRRPVLLA